MKKIVFSLISGMGIVLLSGCSSKHHHTTPPVNTNVTHQALLVGVSDYAGTDNDLIGIDKDISRMQTVLRNWGFAIDTLRDTQSVAFEQKMAHYAQTLGPEDVFLLYYSGHGSSTPDRTHDEADGRDELIVLSDANRNHFLLDDKINLLLNRIQARKMVIFDACNSGTAYKRLRDANGERIQVKYMAAPKDFRDDSGENATVPNTQISGTYLYFAACRDNEQSLASENGSLFTNAFIESATLGKTPVQIKDQATGLLHARFHPQVSASTPAFQYSSIGRYLKLR